MCNKDLCFIIQLEGLLNTHCFNIELTFLIEFSFAFNLIIKYHKEPRHERTYQNKYLPTVKQFEEETKFEEMNIEVDRLLEREAQSEG